MPRIWRIAPAEPVEPNFFRNRKTIARLNDAVCGGFKMKLLSRWLALVFSVLVLFPGVGSTQAPYYAGKTITVIEGNSAGGVADLRTRTIMQFLQKYIPGNPMIVS